MTDGSRCEARVALTLEGRGILPPVVERPDHGDVCDGDGQIWDLKAPHSRSAIIDRIATRAAIAGDAPPSITQEALRGEFDVEVEILRAIGQQACGEGVVFDVRRLSMDEARSLIAEVNASRQIDPDRIRFFPTEEELVALEGDAQDGG